MSRPLLLSVGVIIPIPPHKKRHEQQGQRKPDDNAADAQVDCHTLTPLARNSVSHAWRTPGAQ